MNLSPFIVALLWFVISMGCGIHAHIRISKLEEQVRRNGEGTTKEKA